MKAPLLTACLAALCHAGRAESVVRFANGDQLAGKIASLDPSTLAWDSPVFEKPAPFFLRQVVDLTLTGETPEVKADHEATVTLTRGDSARGQLVAVNDRVVALDTWYAGRIEFNRLMVDSVHIEGQSKLLYRGPTGIDGWTQAEGGKAWSYSHMAFVSQASGSIARDDLLAEECVVSFDAAWKGDSFGLKLILFSDDVNSETPSSGYEMSFQRGSVYLRNCRTQTFLGSAHSGALAERDRVSIEIRASRRTGKVCLFINKRIIEVWNDPDVARGRFGNALHFVSQTPMPLRISRIGVAPWDGVVTEVPEPRLGMMRQQFGIQGMPEVPKPSVKPRPGGNRMELANGDSLEGEVATIDNGLITIKSPLGEVKLPVGRLRTIALPKVEREEAIRRNGDVRAWFPDGSHLTFRLESSGDGTITGSSQNFGTATFKLNSFNRIEFNIYDPELENKRAAEQW